MLAERLLVAVEEAEFVWMIWIYLNARGRGCFYTSQAWLFETRDQSPLLIQ
jgi:hypothetical protein